MTNIDDTLETTAITEIELLALYKANCGHEVKHSNAGALRFMEAAFQLGAQAQMQAIVQAADATREDMDAYAKQVATTAINQTDENRCYILEAKSGLHNFEPNAWVIEAIKQSYRWGVLQRDHDHDFMVNQIEEHHRISHDGIIRATVAAVLESFMNMKDNFKFEYQVDGPQNGQLISVSAVVDMNAQRDIWDRLHLVGKLDGNFVTWTLRKNDALPIPE